MKIKIDPEEKSHMCMIHHIGISLQKYLVKDSSIIDLQPEKEFFELLGFQNGKHPETDTRAVGFLGPLLIINFFERAEMLYK